MATIINSYENDNEPKKQKEIEYSNTWATIVYSDEELNKCIEICKTRFYSAVISPNHCKDEFDNGEPKKPHWHILFLFKSKKSRNQMNILFKEFGGVGVEHINNKEKYYEYLWHDEQTDKPIYDPNELIYINCNENDFVNNVTVLHNLIDIIITENIYSMSDLRNKIIEYYGSISNPILYVISNKTALLNSFLRDNYNKEKLRLLKEQKHESRINH